MRVVLIAIVLLLTGCVNAPEAEVGSAAAEGAPSADPAPLGLAGTACWEGGGHSVHPISFNPLPEPWTPADVIGDVGPQFVYSEVPDLANPVPSEGTTMGNWHATVWCEGWTLDGVDRPDVFFGYVGMKVETPPFEDATAAPASHQYLVTVVATNDDELLARLTAGGIAAIKARAEKVAVPDGTLRVQMWTEGNGDYDSLFRPKEMGPMEASRIRIWFQSTPEGHAHGHEPSAERADRASGEFHPITLDLVSTGGTHLAAEGQGYFSHSGTAHHAPLPGAYGHTAAFGHAGFDRVIEWGPRPEIILTEAYLH